jgi:hypothetical protein
LLDFIVSIIAATGSIIGIVLAIRSWRKKPHVRFLIQRADFTLFNNQKEENVSLLLCRIFNQKHFFGDAAKKVSGRVIYKAPTDDFESGLDAFAGIPWGKTFHDKFRIEMNLNSEEDVINAIETALFRRTSVDIPEGRGDTLIVAYGIQISNKLYLASDPSIEIPLPEALELSLERPLKRRAVMTCCPLRVEIAGENLPSTVSEGTMIFGSDWNNWTYPAKVETVKTPSVFLNFLLRLGIGKETKVIDTM